MSSEYWIGLMITLLLAQYAILLSILFSREAIEIFAISRKAFVFNSMPYLIYLTLIWMGIKTAYKNWRYLK